MVQFREGESYSCEETFMMAGLDAQGETAAGADDASSGGASEAQPAGAAAAGAAGAGATHAAKEQKEGGRMRNLKMSFRTLSAARRTNDKDKNEPSRFLGEGVSFKAKLIGILEVSEARGDRMCQEALADLKMAIRAAGEHKQRININIAIDGLRLRDEKTGDCLYHHPVHKISFIAQDMSDSRAFGYIFGSPDTGHRFFGIKTDKAASQVVIAMRDLFQVVFELKKKEIELAKQHIEQTQIKLGGTLFIDSASTSKNGGSGSDQSSAKMRTIQEDSVKENGTGVSASKASQPTSEVIADLLDLEFELNSIQQGIHQMERITPSDPFGPSTKEDPFASDPFGDSFTLPAAFPKSSKQPAAVAILPPPPSAKDSARGDPFHAPPPGRGTLRRQSRPSPAAAPDAPAAAAAAPAAPAAAAASAPAGGKAAPVQQQEKHWFDQETESLFEEGELVTPPLPSSSNVPGFPSVPTALDQEKSELSKSPTMQSQQNQTDSQSKSGGQFDVFTELDPLGTGRVKPYIDRKDFFQELKNPPKKVLKDLVTEAPSSEATAPLFHATFDSGSSSLTVNDSVPCSSSKDVLSSAENTTTNTSVCTTTASTSTSGLFSSAKTLDIDPFKDTDPFDKTDPFAEDDFSQLAGFPHTGNSHDPFDTGFADFTMFGRHSKKDFTPSFPELSSVNNETDVKRASPHHSEQATSVSPQPTLHGPLRVSLPPEKSATEAPAPIPPYPGSSATPHLASPSGTLTKGKSRSRLPKQASLASGMIKLPSPKSSQRSSRLIKQTTVDGSHSAQNLQASATSQISTTSSHSDRKSPSSQGILESVTLRNRSVVTPSPPIVACFPDISDLDSSRLSGSSAELAEIAPEPPPRPATNITPIKPPPLPPKRQQVGNIMKPPPRPPHSDHPHYDYIENYETSISPTPQEAEEVKSPPIPVPARRPRFGDADLSEVPQRPRRQYQSTATISEPDYLPPIPILPPPQKKSPATDTSRNLSISKPRTPVMTTIASILQSSTSSTTTPATDQAKQPVTAKSLNITISQLTKSGLSDLAAALGVSPGHLSNMTLQDLTKCLSKIQSADNNVEEIKSDTSAIKRDKYDALRESVDEEPEFKADFETNFEPPPSTSEKLEDVFQETPFDKYAVFRELIVQTKDSVSSSAGPMESETEAATVDAKTKETAEETKATSEDDKAENPTEDRYAALREISLGETDVDKDDADTSSEKEECPTEVPKLEEDIDLLTLSRQQSEGTESPTVEAPAPREPQSIIESTIFEEDISALEAEIVTSQETTQPIEVSKKESPSDTTNINTKEEPLQDQIDVTSQSPEQSDNNKKMSLENKPEEPLEGWAKFDVGTFPLEKPPSEGHSEGVVSPWSSDGKEFNKPKHPPEEIEEVERGRRRRSRRPVNWHEDEESEEGWDDRRGGEAWERPWRENGWSDGESFYDDMPPYRDRMYYYEERRGRRRRVSPWKRGQRSSRDPSPWEGEGKEDEDENWAAPSKRWHERSVDDEEEEEEEDYEVSWRSRPKHRGSSWDEERHRRYGGRDVNGAEYEERRKRRPSPWGGGAGGGTPGGGAPGGGAPGGGAPGGGAPGGGGGGNGSTGGGTGGTVGGEAERRSSWESGSWDEEERFARDGVERRFRGEEERWRREMERDGRCGWGRRYADPPPRRKHRYYRDRSRESPWEDEYSEHGEDEAPRYPMRKRNWPKRPSSASEMRRGLDKASPGEYKARIMEKQQHSLPNVPRQETPEKAPYGYSDRRYRDKSGSRPRSREGHFGSDQEYDYWPPERPRRVERESYEQRSQTLHPRRPPRHKKSAEWSYSQKSPFDDDFSMQAFEFADPGKAQAKEPEAHDSGKKRSPAPSSQSPLPAGTEAAPRPAEAAAPGGEAAPKEPSSAHEPPGSPEAPEEPGRTKGSRGSAHRQSPFEDDFTPPESRHPSGRRVSSMSSDVSDHRRSPLEDARSGCRVESVVEENECESEFDPKNAKGNDDVFLPPDSATESVHSAGDQAFTDLESSAFNSSVSDVQTTPKPSADSKRIEKRSLWSSEESSKSEKHYTGMKVRMSNLFRADSSSSLRKSESINIFARESDPFDDEFFSCDVSNTLPRPKSEQGRTTEKSNVNNNNNNSSDPFNWTKAFDSFNFEEEK